MSKQILSDKLTATPFLRWAGGKMWLFKELAGEFDIKFNDYHEPFVGGGAFFIKLKSSGLIKQNAFLNDSNKALINAYTQLKYHPQELFAVLRSYKNNESTYYRIRKSKPNTVLEQAAKFIFLNRTCFNGIYRVNLKGEFNVPFGYKHYANLFDFDNLLEVHGLLKKKVTLTSKDFADAIGNIKQNDLVFIDPPYTVKHENNGFLKYNETIFSWEDQKRLKQFIQNVKDIKAYFILTNAAHYSISDLFKPIAKPKLIARQSLVGGKDATRGLIHEYVFSNCLGA